MFKTNTSKWVTLLIVLIALAVLSLSFFYVNLSHTKLRIANLSSEYIEKVEIQASGEIVWTGKLKPKQAKNIWFNPKRDGSFQMTGVVNENKINSDELGYISPNLGSRIILRYLGDNKFEDKYILEKRT